MIFRFEHEEHDPTGFVGPSGPIELIRGYSGPVVLVTLKVGPSAEELRSTGWLLMTRDEWQRFRAGTDETFVVDEVHLMDPDYHATCGPLGNVDRMFLARDLERVTCRACKERAAAAK